MHKVTTKFSGGLSINSKSGLDNSFRFAKHLSIYADDDSVTLNPQPVKVSGSTVVGLIKWFVTTIPFTPGDRWGYDDAGNLYRTDGGITWSLERSGGTIGHGAAGQGLIVFQNALFYASSTTLGTGSPLSNGTGAIVWDDNFIHTLALDIDGSQSLSGNTYTPPVAVSELAADKLSFNPGHDPIEVVEVIFGTKGTGALTVLVHDSNNVTVATKTVASIDLPASGVYDFRFDTPWRPILGRTYHIHIVSTIADATLQTGSANTLSTLNYVMFFGVLQTNTDLHAMIQHTNGVTGTIVIANNDYFAVWDGATYNPNQIRIEPGYQIRGFARENEFIVAYAWKGSDITAVEDGRLYYWDGIAPYYNYSKPVNGGMPQAVVNFKNRLFSTHGETGIFSLQTDPFRTIQPVPFLTSGESVSVLPGSITTWQNRAHIGVGLANGTNTGLIQGVYEFGSQSDRAVSYTSVSGEVLNFGYTISTGDEQGQTMKIGAVAGFGNALYIAWKSEAGTYGVDQVKRSNIPASTGSYESLIDDSTFDPRVGAFVSAPQKTKEAKMLVIKYNALPTGCTVTPKYKFDRAASWTYATNEQIGVAGTAQCSMQINGRYHEIEYGFDLAATTDYPVITGMYYSFNPLSQERNNS